MKQEDYINAIEQLNREYNELYSSRVLAKRRRNKRIINYIKTYNFKALFNGFWLRVTGYNSNSKKNYLPSVISKKRDGKIVVYTCIVGEYDNLLEPLILTPDTDYVVYSDNPKIVGKGSAWIYKSIPKEIQKKCQNNCILINRYIKMHPKELFPKYDLSLYIDGSMRIMSDIASCFYYINDSTGLAMHNHRIRDDVYEEAKACIMTRKGNKKCIKELMKKYENERFPHQYGLLEATIIASDLNNPLSYNLLGEWYQEFIKSDTYRDQLTLTYVLWKNNLECKDVGILCEVIPKNYKFRRYEHLLDFKYKLKIENKK